MLTVLWHNPESAGYTDLLPEDWFLKERVLNKCTHAVLGPKSGSREAKCNVTIHATHAILDYEPFAAFNLKNAMYLGMMRVEFTDISRTSVTQILWKDQESASFELCSTTISRKQPNERDAELDEEILEILTTEGRRRIVAHLRRERSQKLIAGKKRAVSSLACEACAFKFEDKYGELGKTYCEVHHRKPLAETDEVETTLADLAILCSNCHRMIHRTEPMLSVEDFREAYLTTNITNRDCDRELNVSPTTEFER